MLGFRTVKVKERSKQMYDLCLKRAKSIGHTDFIKSNGKSDLTKTFRIDMLNFLVYIAFSDGRISKEEYKYINLLMGTEFTKESIIGYANTWGLQTESIKEQPPRSLEPFVRSNVGGETGEISNEYYDLVQLYVTTFNYIGNDLIASNDDINPGEVQALSSYIMMLTESIEEIQGKMEAYKPTIAFEHGSKVKQEVKPDYTYNDTMDSMTFDMRDSLGQRPIREKLAERTEKTEKTQETASKEVSKTARGMEEQKQVQKQTDVSEEYNVDVLLRNLNELTGMVSVKNEINNMINLLRICKIREEKGLQTPPVTNHMVFLGNPGTGKTTVARILSKIYCGLGVLSKGHLVEVDRSGLVAGYMGQTSEKVMEVIERAKGGILFIDEAYALATKQEGDFGQEAIDILNKAMEDNREDLIVIAAGYHDEMQSFLDANPGLRSRFNRTIEFPNYEAEELVEIMCNRAKSLDYTLTQEAIDYVKAEFAFVLADPPENFGNARSVRNYLERVIRNQANRLVAEANFKEEDLQTLTLTDVKSEELE